MTKNEENWQRNYLQLKEFVKIHGSLPNKKKVEKGGKTWFTKLVEI